MPKAPGLPALSSSLRRRILRARKTGREREFELMLALRPDRPSLVAEGDSWFAYPSPNLAGIDNRSNVINWLTRSARLNLLQLASNGDEAVQMLTGPGKHRLLRVLQRFPVDFLLFSGGGNDIVGRHDFDFLLRDGSDIHSNDCRDYLHTGRVERRLALIEMSYADLVDYCGEYSRNDRIRIITHCYDYAIPGPGGAVFAGGLLRPDGGRSWMHPALLQKNIPTCHHAAIARHLIDALAERLLRLQQRHPERLFVVDTRGQVRPAEWVNEIHPDRQGFGRISQLILHELRGLDGRI
jgi:hypothetical protein